MVYNILISISNLFSKSSLIRDDHIESRLAGGTYHLDGITRALLIN